jgi:hypothetical protein
MAMLLLYCLAMLYDVITNSGYKRGLFSDAAFVLPCNVAQCCNNSTNSDNKRWLYANAAAVLPGNFVQYSY